MSLIITFMFEPAKLQMNCARASGARKLRRETVVPSDGLTGLLASPMTTTSGEHPDRQREPQGSLHVDRRGAGTLSAIDASSAVTAVPEGMRTPPP
jgi:hypothetical protein